MNKTVCTLVVMLISSIATFATDKTVAFDFTAKSYGVVEGPGMNTDGMVITEGEVQIKLSGNQFDYYNNSLYITGKDSFRISAVVGGVNAPISKVSVEVLNYSNKQGFVRLCNIVPDGFGSTTAEDVDEIYDSSNETVSYSESDNSITEFAIYCRGDQNTYGIKKIEVSYIFDDPSVSVSNISCENKYEVRGNEIIVNNDYELSELYQINGIKIGGGTKYYSSLKSGLYVLKIGNKAYKVAVY